MGRELSNLALCLIGASFVGLGLAWLYQVLGGWSQTPWWSIACLHTGLTVLALGSQARLRHALLTRGRTWWVWGPALLVLNGAWLLPLLSGGDKHLRFDLAPETLAWIVWIPLIEEILYRGVLAHELQKRIGLWLGAYCSSLIFALAHAPFPENWSQALAIPIGPFLLGMACTFVYQKSASLWSPVLLHMSCNATPLLFQTFDPRWLSWLHWLYSKP